MALKKVKPDARFTSKSKNVSLAHARGTSISKAEQQDRINKDIRRIKGDQAVGLGTVSVQQPGRNAQGQTATDIQIAANKAALAASQQSDPLSTPDPNFDPGRADAFKAPVEANWLQSLAGMTDLEVREVREAAEIGLETQRTGTTVAPTAYGLALAEQAIATGGQSLFTGASGPAYKVSTRVGQQLIKNNPYTQNLVGNILKGAFSKKAMAALSFWAGSVLIGLWGAAEAPEAYTFQIDKNLIKNAQETGDWSLVNEAKTLRAEVTQLKDWEKFALWSPISGFVGIPMKLKATFDAARINDKVTADMQIQSETGETDEEKRIRVTQEFDDAAVNRAELVAAVIEDSTAKSEEARKQGRNEDAAFWTKYAADKAAQSLIDIEKELQLRNDYWIENNKVTVDNYDPPSALGFGILGK